MLDILLPNYDNVERFCNFYYEIDPNSEPSEEEEFVIITNQEIKSRENSCDTIIEDKASQGVVKLVYALSPPDFDVVVLEYTGDALI